ncbi:MAG: hypothetical protein KDD61_12105 [Bdellovibrionales bacterium]|nr:hypothetical protein [Bdellovibrionales bacterium]
MIRSIGAKVLSILLFFTALPLWGETLTATITAKKCDFVSRTFLQWIYRSHVQNLVEEELSDEQLLARIGTVMRNFDAPFLLSYLDQPLESFSWDLNAAKDILNGLFTFTDPNCETLRSSEFESQAGKAGIAFEELLLKSLALSMDPHSTYYTANQLELFSKKMGLSEVQSEDKIISRSWNFDGKSYAAIKLPLFYHGSGKDFSDILKQLKPEELSGLIVDVRDNIGGQTEESIAILSHFLGARPLGMRYGFQLNRNLQAPEILVFRASRPSQVIYKGPLIVLINGGSGSASEVFAAAIQDYQRGWVVGPNATFGKGTLQEMLPVDAGAVKVTTSFLFRVTGQPLQQRGVIPDISIGYESEKKVIRERDLLYSLKAPEAIDTRRKDKDLYSHVVSRGRLKEFTDAYKSEEGADNAFELSRSLLVEMGDLTMD